MSFASNSFSRQRAPMLGCALYMLVLGAALAALAGLAQAVLPLGPGYAERTLLVYAAVALSVFMLAVYWLDDSRFGAANRVTMGRAALTILLAALLTESASDALAWFVVATATVVLMLDGVDGWLARRGGRSTHFGARFDMETDAALILILAALCWQFGKAGPWILAAGLMRYAFVAAARIWPVLGQPLPPSRRRQTICIVQSIGLLVCISPIAPVPFSDLAALLTLALLTWSFGVDIAWAARQPKLEPAA